MKVTAAVCIALFAIVVAAISILKHPVYTPDGIVYARFAARYAGDSQRDATLASRVFYERTPMMSKARYRDLVEVDPSVAFARSRVFVNRPLYPWLVAMLLPVAGFRALFLVNACAYVLFGLSLFWTLCAFRKPGFSLVLTIAALALPAVRAYAASDLTDMVSMVWFTLALGALLRLTRETRPSLLVLLALSSILLCLTRPTPYLVALPALALGLARRGWWPFIVTFAGVFTSAAVAAVTHAYGIVEQLRWVYDNEPVPPNSSFAAWYRSSLFHSVRNVVSTSIRSVVPLAIAAGAVYGMWRARTRAEMSVLVGALVACLLAVPFNPVPSSFERVLLLPLIPVFCAIVQLVGEDVAFARVHATARAVPEVPA